VIARLAAQLRCYVPERTDQTWARLRHLGARRARLVTAATAAVQQLRDLLDCVWPAVLDAAASPFRSASWQASLAVVLDRAAGDLTRVRRLGVARFHRCGPGRAAPLGRHPPVPAHRAGGVRRSGRSGRGHRPATGRARTRPACAGRLAGHPPPARRGRDPHGRSARRARVDRPGDLDRRADRGRGRGHPRRDRRPDPVR
jgi:hypothetical protein